MKKMTMRNKIVILLLIVFAIFLSANTAFAATSLKIQGGIYFQHLSGNFNVGSQTSSYIPTDITPSMIGLPSSDNALYLTAILNAGNNRLAFTYIPTTYKGSRTLSEQVNFDNQTYNINNAITSKLAIQSYKLFYNYNFSITKYVKIGPGIGIDDKNITAQISDSTLGFSDSKSVNAPIPLIGADIEILPVKNLTISGKVQGIGYSGNSYYYVIGKVEYDIMEHASIFGEYIYNRLNINIDNVNGHLTFSGPVAGIGVKF